MSTRCTTPQASAAGSTRCATLWVPKVTVTAAGTCGPSTLTGVDVDAGRDVHRDDRDPREAAHHGGGVVAQPAAAADPHDPVDHDVGPRDGRPPRRGRRRRAAPRDPLRAPCPGSAAAPRPAPRAGRAARRRTARRRRCRPTRRAAAPARRTPGPSRSSTAYASPARGPLHQRALGQPCHQGPPRPPGPARRCVRCACRSTYPARTYRCTTRVHGQVISAQTASSSPGWRQQVDRPGPEQVEQRAPRRACGRGSRS